MPLVCDPDMEFDVVLDCDKDKKEDVRPTFIFRCRSARQWGEAERKVDNLTTADCGRGALDKLAEAINDGLVGWRNMVNNSGGKLTVSAGDGEVVIEPGKQIPFASETLMSIITPGEAWDLYYGALKGGMVMVADLKKSASPSLASTEESAADAGQEQPT